MAKLVDDKLTLTQAGFRSSPLADFLPSFCWHKVAFLTALASLPQGHTKALVTMFLRLAQRRGTGQGKPLVKTNVNSVCKTWASEFSKCDC